MTPEQQQIATAEACGWTEIMVSPGFACRDQNAFPKGKKDGTFNKLPDYPNDLNAMHEAEQALWRKDWNARHTFIDHLARIINPIHGYRDQTGVDLVDATAAQRAEAFLRTLGLWKE
jgi:hypothetical protein